MEFIEKDIEKEQERDNKLRLSQFTNNLYEKQNRNKLDRLKKTFISNHKELSSEEIELVEIVFDYLKKIGRE